MNLIEFTLLAFSVALIGVTVVQQSYKSFRLRPNKVRVFYPRTFIDTETAEPFEVWRGATGFRLILISFLLKP
jgi:hypothetical protein